MISLGEARATIERNTTPLDGAQVPLAEATGAILREGLLAPEDLPAFDRSAMDGYAVALDDASDRFRVSGEAQPGGAVQPAIVRGECLRIFTGAPIPPGASQVLMQEHVRREGEWMIPLRRGKERNIRVRGEDARRGELLLPAGSRLGPGEMALLAYTGTITPRVTRAVRILHVATGNELVDPSEEPPAGKIRDSNSTLVAALIGETRARLVAQHRCGDDLETLLRLIRSESEAWDALLISGGASVGDYDFGAKALEQLGFTIHFQRVNLRPGKPTVFASRGRQLAFVIPGNPVSHFVVFHLLVRSALELLEGAPLTWRLVEVVVAEPVICEPDTREIFWPAHVRLEAGDLVAKPLAWRSSGDLRGLVSVNALLQIPPGTAGLRGGARAHGLLLAQPA
jgi:molybdopterin molybdotransferase